MRADLIGCASYNSIFTGINMKRRSIFIVSLLVILLSMSGCGAIVEESFNIVEESFDKALERTSIKNKEQPLFEWKKIPNATQHQLSDWKNEIKRVKKVTLEEAKAIAEADNRIDYFFHIRPGKLGIRGKKLKEIFWAGDAVFFSGKPNYAKAHERSDIYQKQYQQ